MRGEYDVIIAGGGVSGCMAAVAAARNGARSLVIERYGFLGGALTNAGVGPMMTFHADNEQVVRGLAQELVDRLRACGGGIGHIEDTTGYCATVTPFEPEALKRVLDDMLAECGCEALFHSVLCGAQVENGRIKRIDAASKDGVTGYCARVYIDATGDGDLSARAGAKFKIGREADGMCQPMTTNFRVANVDTDRLIDEIRREPDNFNIRDLSSIERAGRVSLAGFYRQFNAAKAAGRVHSEREDVLMFESVVRGTFVVNTTRVIRLSAVNPGELSRAEAEGRKQADEVFRFLKAEAAGFENAYMVCTGAQIGVRESRRIAGLYELSADDLLSARRFDDAVACGAYPIDIHNPTGANTNTIRLNMGAHYQIPLGALTVKGFSNLFVCGRCLSATHEAGAAIRVTPIAMATGQAAGTAAAVCALTKTDAGKADAEKIRELLRKQQAFID